jgi:plasmid stabilization system protein ParE
VKVVWSDRALRSLADIHSHISADSLDAANRTVDAILKRGDRLAQFPHLGRVVERYAQPDIRELVESPYRIVYRVRSESVEVIDVFHSAQLPPWER